MTLRVKALCGVMYKGELYRAGDEFDADKVLPNTVALDSTETDVIARTDDIGDEIRLEDIAEQEPEPTESNVPRGVGRPKKRR